MDRRFLGILGAIIIIFFGIFLVSQHSNGSSNKNGSTSGAQPTNNVQGQGTKGVTLIEYGDFQCPICEEFYQPVKQVVAENSQDIYFQFRNLPLTSLHPNAFSAARAAQAAALQGKFWQMHDKLYENQSQWASATNPLSYFQTYGQEIGLNMSKFNSDYSSSGVNDTINADLAAFAKTGQEQATPTFFLDGKVLTNTELIDTKTGTISVDKFNQLIAQAIAAKNK